MTHQEATSQNKVLELIRKCRGSRRLVLLIVVVALLLDNMLLTTVVPIIPSFLYQLHHAEAMEELNQTSSSTTDAPSPPTWTLSDPYLRPRVLPYPRRESSRQPDDESWDGLTTTTVTPNESLLETTLSSLDEEIRHEELVNENVEVGVMFASKPIVQAFTNPFIGALTNRIGYTVPMFSGFIIMFLSTLIFASGTTYFTLFIARALQGVGSACTSVAGMGMLAHKYPDDRERGNAMAVALGGLALGVLIGPPFGGFMYEFVGKSAPFMVLAALALLDGLLQLLVLRPQVCKEDQEGASLLTLIKDPYIVIAAGSITFANMGIASLEPSLPLWMMDTMNAPKWQQGAAFLPASISYLIGTNVFGTMGHKMGRWLATMMGLIIIGICLFCIPLARNINHLIPPNAGIGFAIGMVDSSMMPMLGYLVDIRHTSVYGSVYAIGDVAFCVGFAVGPALGGSIVQAIGFKGLVYTFGITCFAYAPLMVFLKRPPGRDENQTLLLKDTSVRYVSYTSEETPEEEDVKKPSGQEWVK